MEGPDRIREAHKRTAITAKEMLCASVKGRFDLPPRFMVWMQDGSTWGGDPGQMTAAAIQAGIPVYDLMVQSVKTLIHRLAIEDSRITAPRSFICILEGYCRRGVDADKIDVGSYERGDMAKDFSDNPATDVAECLSTYYVEDDLVGGVDFYSITTPYHYGDGGRIVWEEEFAVLDTPDAKQLGALYEAFVSLIKESQ